MFVDNVDHQLLSIISFRCGEKGIRMIKIFLNNVCMLNTLFAKHFVKLINVGVQHIVCTCKELAVGD